jgi:hypothetical protein
VALKSPLGDFPRKFQFSFPCNIKGFHISSQPPKEIFLNYGLKNIQNSRKKSHKIDVDLHADRGLADTEQKTVVTAGNYSEQVRL